MSSFDEIFERITSVTNTRTQMELAEVLSIRQSSISDAKRRNSVPADWYIKLFEQYNLNPDWLKKGVEPVYLHKGSAYAASSKNPAYNAKEDLAAYNEPEARGVVIPVCAMREWTKAENNAKRGTKGATSGRLCIPASFAGPGIKVFIQDSGCLEPLIRKGAYVALDTGRRNIISGELYGMILPLEGLGIRRIFIAGEGQAVLRAEHPECPEISMPFAEVEERCVGQLVWSLNSFV